MSDSSRPSDTFIRDSNANRPDSVAPPGIPENTASVPRRSFHADEGEPDRGEWWSLLKAVLIVLAVMALIGWLLSL